MPEQPAIECVQSGVSISSGVAGMVLVAEPVCVCEFDFCAPIGSELISNLEQVELLVNRDAVVNAVTACNLLLL